MKVALVHDWLVTWGGAENVVKSILKLYPQADIYTLVCDRKKMEAKFPENKIFTSSLQKLPFSTKLYTKLLKFMPKAFEEFDFSNYDLVICSSSCCAKGVITPPSVPHIAYIHTPMRYAWDLFFDYKKHSGKLTKFFMNKWMPQIRQWDYISSQRIDTLIANSNYIARRIKKFWNREATVIYPPVDVTPLANEYKKENYYVAFSRFVSYKRIDLAIQACGELNRKLIVIGSGALDTDLKKLANQYKNTDITFTGRIDYDKVHEIIGKSKALIFCAEEDFGIIPVEVQALGVPVIAYNKGGACETVKENISGVFFDKQETECVKNAIKRFEELDEKGTFKKNLIIEHAQSFSEERFLKEFSEIVTKTIQ